MNDLVETSAFCFLSILTTLFHMILSLQVHSTDLITSKQDVTVITETTVQACYVTFEIQTA